MADKASLERVLDARAKETLNDMMVTYEQVMATEAEAAEEWLHQQFHDIVILRKKRVGRATTRRERTIE